MKSCKVAFSQAGGHTFCPSHSTSCCLRAKKIALPFNCVHCTNLIRLAASDSPVQENHRFNAKALYKGWIRKLFRGRQFSFLSQCLFEGIPFLKGWLSDKGWTYSMSDVVAFHLNSQDLTDAALVASQPVHDVNVNVSGIGGGPSYLSFSGGQGLGSAVLSLPSASGGALMAKAAVAKVVDVSKPPPGFEVLQAQAGSDLRQGIKNISDAKVIGEDTDWVEVWGQSMAKQFSSMLQGLKPPPGFPRTGEIQSREVVEEPVLVRGVATESEFSGSSLSAHRRELASDRSYARKRVGDRQEEFEVIKKARDSSSSYAKMSDRDLDDGNLQYVLVPRRELAASAGVQKKGGVQDIRAEGGEVRLGMSVPYSCEFSSRAYLPVAKGASSPKGGLERGQERAQVHRSHHPIPSSSGVIQDELNLMDSEVLLSDSAEEIIESAAPKPRHDLELGVILHEFMSAQATLNGQINEKLELITSSLLDFKNDATERFDSYNNRVLTLEHGPEGDLDLSDVGSDSSEFMSDEDTSDYIVPVDEVKEFLSSSGISLTQKFEIPSDWQFVRDSTFMLSIKVPDLGIISSSLFNDLGFEDGKRMISFCFSSFVMPEHLPSSNIAVLMKREFDNFVKLSSENFILAKDKPPSERYGGSSHSWTSISLGQDSVELRENITKIFDISRWNSSLMPGIPDYGKSCWGINFLWKEIPEYQAFSELFFENELEGQQLFQFGQIQRARNELLEEKRTRHVLANAFSAAVQMEVSRSAFSSIISRCSGFVASEMILVRDGNESLRRYLWSAIGPTLLNWFKAKHSLRAAVVAKCPTSIFKKELLHGSPYNNEIFSEKSISGLTDLARMKGTDPLTLLNNPRFPAVEKTKKQMSFTRGRGQAAFRSNFRGFRPDGYGRGMRDRGNYRPRGNRFSQRARGYRGIAGNTKGKGKGKGQSKNDQYE